MHLYLDRHAPVCLYRSKFGKITETKKEWFQKGVEMENEIIEGDDQKPNFVKEMNYENHPICKKHFFA